MNHKQLLFVFLFISPVFIVFGQDSNHVSPKIWNYATLRVSYGPGTILATNDFFRTNNKAGQPLTEAHALNTEIIFQTIGDKSWHNPMNYPKIGIGIQTQWFPQTDEFGSPISAYGILEGPIHRWGNAQLDWAFHFGVSLGWNAYDSVTNPYNVAIGSASTLYAHFGIVYHQNIFKRFGLDASIGLSHASNGAIKMPNFGINILDPRIALTYNLYRTKPEFTQKEFPKTTKPNAVSLHAAIGTKQIDFYSLDPAINNEFKNKNYTIYNLVGLYSYQVSVLSRIGAGIDFTIDSSDNADGLTGGDSNATYPPPFNEKAKLALVLSYELCLGKFSFVLQPAFYFYRTTHDPTPFFYQRIGVRYDVYRNLTMGASLRAVNFGQADWVELTLGYKLKW